MIDLPAHMKSAQLDPDQRRRLAVDLRWRFRNARSIVYKTISAWIDHDAASMGAALAFYTLFSIAPILVIAVAVAGYVFGPHVAETQVLVQLSALIGDTGANAIRDLLLSAHYSDKKGFAAAVGIITLLIGATSVFGELQNTLGRIWNTPKRAGAVVWWQYVRARILSIGLVLGVGFLLLVSLVASAALAALESMLGSFMTQWSGILPAIDLILSFAMTTLLFAMIYKYVPNESITWSDVWIGAVITALLFTVGKFLIGIYLGRSAFNSAYGAAGSLVVLLLWIYYSAQIFLLGAEFTCVATYEYGSRRAPATTESE
jgi:membrane protein